MRFHNIASCAGLTAFATGALGSGPCNADFCFAAVKHRPFAKSLVSAFCEEYITSTPPATAYVTSTVAVDSTATPSPATTTTTITQTSTTSTSLATYSDYSYRSSPPNFNDNNAKRAVAEREVAKLAAIGNCGNGRQFASRVSKGCSCFLTASTTSTVFVSSTTVVATQPLVTETTTATVTVTTAGGSYFCGASVSAYGASTITCASAANPTETSSRHRIEGGGEGTIYEDCISAGPMNVTTPSGGTHLCDGTNNGANPNPGGTITGLLANAGALSPTFGYDGPYESQFQDYFIETIDVTNTGNNEYWGVLASNQFTPNGGCQSQYSSGEPTEWFFNAFNANYFLLIEQDMQVVQPGASVSVLVSSSNGGPASGATFVGQTVPSDGIVTFNAPSQEGCYQFKATDSQAIRSNAFYLTVVSSLS